MFRTLLLAALVTAGFMFANTSQADAGGRRFYRAPAVRVGGYYGYPARRSVYRAPYSRAYYGPRYYRPNYYGRSYGYRSYGYGPGFSIGIGF
ncbi:hypothetical protein [Bremerella cremea]|uniref:hypothetical protein n=1 Tax=Bremerella cremea TaxID=1031537 RepID=UPI0031EAC79E